MNPYAIPPLITSILALFLGSLTLRSINPRVRYTFPLVSICVFIWLFGYFLVYSTAEYEVALKWIRLLYIGVIFIPAVSYHFTIAFLNLRRSPKRIITIYLISAIFAILSRDKSFLAGAYRYFWGYQTKAGPWHNIFLIFFSIVMLRVIMLLLFQYREKRKTSPSEGNRIKYVLISFFASTFAILDFLPNYGIEWYPLGFIFIAFHATLSTYAIIRYRILDVNVAIARAGIFSLVYLVVLGLPITVGYRLLGYGAWLIPLLVTALFASAGPFIFTYFQHKAEQRLRREEFLAHQALNKLAQNMMRFTKLELLLKLIVRNVVRIMKVHYASIYLRGEDNKHCLLKATWGVSNGSPKHSEFSEDSELVKDILFRGVPIMLEELVLSGAPMVVSHTKKLQLELRTTNTAVVIPAFKGKELFGFLMLGHRKNNRIFTQEDLNLLMLLSSQAVLAIENAKLIEKDKNLLAEKSRRDALADMAPGVAHQFDNRLQSICLAAETQILVSEQQDIEKASREELLSLVKQSKNALSDIVKDAVKGREIADVVRKKGRANLEYEKQQLLPIIQSAVTRLKISRTKESLQGATEPEIIIDAEEGLPALLLKQSQTDDVFYNLLDNARDAIIQRNICMQDGRLPKEDVPYKGRIAISARKQGDYIVVAVTDNGIGMKDKELRRLFVPWFTTKATSVKGAGMGLNSISAIIEDHKGKISVESEHGKGTIFTIRFPILRE